MLLGRYPDDVPPLPVAGHGDDARSSPQPLDVLGVNYYFRQLARAGSNGAGPSPWVGARDVKFVSRGLPRTEMGWEIDASGSTTSSPASTATTRRSRST